MNGEGQRPPAPPDTAQASTDAPEPGNARYPQPGGGGAPRNKKPRPPQRRRPPPPQHRPPRSPPRHEPAQPVEGVLDVDHRGNGRLRNPKYNFLPQQDDVDVPRHIIDRDRLRGGVMLTGQAVRRNGRLQLIKTDSVEGLPPQEAARRTAFQNLTVVDPDDRVVLETTSKELLTRVIDIVAPIGLGQRMLIVAPPKTGKTIMLQKICHAVTQNRPEVQQMVLLVDER